MIKYNKFGEVISVNGITTGQHLGTPMQDVLGDEVSNSAYGTEQRTVTNCDNTIVDLQPEGGSDGGSKLAESLVDGTITELSSDSITVVRAYALYGCKTLSDVDLPNVKTIGEYAFSKCDGLEKVYAPKVTLIESYAFNECTNLKSIDFPEVKSLGNNALYKLTSVVSVNLPNLPVVNNSALASLTSLKHLTLPKTTYLGGSGLANCSALEKLDLPVVATLKSMSLNNDTSLTTLILRNSTNVCSLDSVGVLSNTPIAKGTGYIYVPAALVDSYKAATNWSNFADQIRAIEDYPDICGG